VSEFTVERAGVELAGEEAGDGIPVVLLHGLTATRRYVVMGSSPAGAPDDYGYETLAADLLAVLDDRGIERAVLAGASMGAHTIVRFGLDHGDRAAGIVLITPSYTPEGDHRDLARWDALADGLRDGGIEGFVAAFGDPGVPEAWRETVMKVLRQRLSGHQHPEAVADALRAVPRSRVFEDWAELAELALPAVVVASRDEADPGHPYAVGERYAREIPGAELRSEEPGSSPLAWQGGQLSGAIAALAERAA
jgi:pimeloyl-ACP methyl ester carboxylesterase